MAMAKGDYSYSYPYTLDRIDERILKYLALRKSATAPTIISDLNITESQGRYRLKSLMMSGRVKLDASVKRNMTWSLAGDSNSEE